LKRRAKRDLITLLGVAVIICGVLAANVYARLDSLREQAIKWRQEVEERWRKQDVGLLEWDELQETKGTFRSGATFTETMGELDGHLINIVGFMSPIDQFRNVTEFMLLPMPITCYFCDAPPMRHVLEVKLRAPNQMVNEPVLIGGRLRLHAEKGQPFFYTIEQAKWNEAVPFGELTEKVTPEEHRAHLTMGFQELRGEDGEEELLAPESVPSIDDALSGTGAELGPLSHPGGVPSIDTGPLLQPDEEAGADEAAEDDSS
jgi:hypothetical protein